MVLQKVRRSRTKYFVVCFICLNMLNLATTRRVSSRCREEDCLGRHHKLLHWTKLVFAYNNPGTHLVCSTSETNQSPFRFGAAAVGLTLPFGLTKAFDFVDRGSDTSLIRKKLARKQHSKTPSIAISAAGWTQVMASCRVMLQLGARDKNKQIETKNSYTLTNLPMWGPTPADAVFLDGCTCEKWA